MKISLQTSSKLRFRGLFKLELLRSLSKEPPEELAARVLRDGLDEHHSTDEALIIHLVICNMLRSVDE
jgi:hypothetical protein